MNTRLVWWGLWLASGVGCSETSDPPSLPASVAATLVAGPLIDKPWAERACSGAPQGDVLACVDGVAIDRARLQAALTQAEPDQTAAQVLARLIDGELVANAAGPRAWHSDGLLEVQRRAMVGRILQKSQEEALTAEQIRDEDLAFAWRNPSIRIRYDHAAAYFVTDAQILCCTGDWRQCEGREEVRKCIEDAQVEAQALWAALQADLPASGLEMEGRVASWAGRFPRVTTGAVTFYYDPSKPYSEQKGYDLMVQPFAEAVVALEPGQLVPAPVRSPFGWHISRLDRYQPSQRLTYRDPQVRAEMSQKLLTAVREREALQMTLNLMKARGVELFFERLEPSFLQGGAASETEPPQG